MEPARAETHALVIERTYAVPPRAVFNAWTRPQALERWFAPGSDMRTRVLELDPRVGGRYRIQMIEADGSINTVTGRFEVVDPPRQLIFSWRWEPRPGEQALDYSQTQVIIDIEAVAEGTHMTLTHLRLPNDSLHNEHESGWQGCLDRLGRYAASTVAS